MSRPNSVDGRDPRVQELLTRVRSCIDGDRAEEALAALFDAVRITDGEAGVQALAEQASSDMSRVDDNKDAAEMLLDRMLDTTSLLKERGWGDILSDAFRDGSSVMCTLCGGLISRERIEAHSTTWCPNLPDDEELSYYGNDDNDGSNRNMSDDGDHDMGRESYKERRTSTRSKR